MLPVIGILLQVVYLLYAFKSMLYNFSEIIHFRIHSDNTVLNTHQQEVQCTAEKGCSDQIRIFLNDCWSTAKINVDIELEYLDPFFTTCLRCYDMVMNMKQMPSMGHNEC